MKKILIALFAILLSTSAYAHPGSHSGGHGGYGGGHGGYGGYNHGSCCYGPGWVAPFVAGAIVYDLVEPQPLYVEPPVVAPAVQYLYFCPSYNAYYPNVASCPTAWRLIPR